MIVNNSCYNMLYNVFFMYLYLFHFVSICRSMFHDVSICFIMFPIVSIDLLCIPMYPLIIPPIISLFIPSVKLCPNVSIRDYFDLLRFCQVSRSNLAA